MSGDISGINRLVPGLQSQLIEKNAEPTETENGRFTEVLTNMVNSVNSLQQEAGRAQEMLATGEAADLHQVMIAMEKAGIAMDLLLEVRNRLVEGYQDLVSMPM